MKASRGRSGTSSFDPPSGLPAETAGCPVGRNDVQLRQQIVGTIPIGGVGGFVETPVRIAENVRLRLSDHLVELGDVWTEQNGGADEVFFFRIDRVLGIDVARGCVMVVDAPATMFKLRGPPA